MYNNEMFIYLLSYDKDWRMRGNRHMVFWYRFKKLSPTETKKYICEQLDKDEINEAAYLWEKIVIDRPYKILIGHD